jgi:hypothetical protein
LKWHFKGLWADPEAAKDAHRHTKMATTTQRPFFCVVLSDGQQWAVGAEWPDGAIEQIDAFKHHFEAADSISSQSERVAAGTTTA